MLERSHRSVYAASMHKRSSKESKQLAAAVLKAVTNSAEENPSKNPAAVALGRLGGLRGGKARARMLSKERRTEIAKLAAEARWIKK